jgi:hypothetical protein
LILFTPLALASCGATVVDRSPAAPATSEAEIVSDPPAATATAEPLPTPTPQLSPTVTPQPTATVAPALGEITFAPDITADYEPMSPGLFFTRGITRVHAIFEYRGMSADHTWERVWYYNDQELSRTSGTWTETGSGLFDYSIDNGGDPLPPGDYLLQIFVDGELQTLGMFVVDEAEE